MKGPVPEVMHAYVPFSHLEYPRHCHMQLTCNTKLIGQYCTPSNSHLLWRDCQGMPDVQYFGRRVDDRQQLHLYYKQFVQSLKAQLNEKEVDLLLQASHEEAY